MTQILRIIRWSACVAGAVLLLPAARADVTYSQSDDDLTIVRMNVTPAAEPVPALKYRLLARDIDLKSGNAASFYYRAFLQLPNGMKLSAPEIRRGHAVEQVVWHGCRCHADCRIADRQPA